MGEPTLFDMEPPPAAEPEPELSADRRRTLRQAQALERGHHPLSLLGRPPVRLHPDAPPAGDRKAPGPRCGDCEFIARKEQWLKCTRGRSGEYGTRTFRCGPYETHGAATDLRAWWPGCERWEARRDG
jgi:hypothetical protein